MNVCWNLSNTFSASIDPMNSMKRQKDRTLKDELPRSVGAQYATGDQWRNNSRKNKGMKPKQKQHPVVNETGDRSKVRCRNEHLRPETDLGLFASPTLAGYSLPLCHLGSPS